MTNPTNRTNRICLIEDDEIMGESLADRFVLDGYLCDWHRTAAAAEAALLTREYFLVISDIRLPDLGGDELFARLAGEHVALPPFLFITGQGNIDTAVQLLKLGAQDYITKPFDLDALMDRIQSIAGPAAPESVDALGSSPAMRHIIALLPRLAGSTTTVLITGESGVGKERIARTIHDLGGPERPFVAINCGALTETLLEAELFGYEKGAFTGALRSRRGLFEQADGGTLFLDEIGDMSLGMQTKLLRALQERSITRIGSETPTAVNIRLLCATHRDLKEMVGSGEFREDLYYRINVVQLRVPPLRERREDILWLSRLFLAEFTGHGQKPPVLTAAAEQALMAYPWPGNIRELRNTLERACLLSDSRSIGVDHLFDQPVAATEPQSTGGNLRDYLNEREREFIVRALDTSQWQIQACADTLGISRKTLWEKMRRLGIDKEDIDGVM
ncbi:sigma-54-dependent transcriptional regulator [Propionivibrio sp.]|uniref:sigma-54-dependent transcriptional regulator n=1 Tax=Propionivibrio sp. TaxID=2212460 RepID=UPI00272ED152|nr:sigma-54 dependent transcriptional regulator [Propionivibrio sp.]